jgi:glycosyltransferase involved in cell wall biosynthesis
MTPTLGVVVPARNAAATIGSTLTALRDVAGVELDVVVVDGESTDETAGIAAAMGARVVRQTPRGIYDAVNCGLRIVAGEWLTYINADDVLYADVLAARLKNAASHDVAYGPVDFIDHAGRQLHRWHSARPNHLLSVYQAGMSPLLQQGTLFRRPTFERLQGFDTRWQLVADADFWFRSLEQGFRFQRTTTHSVAAFRMHAGQLGRLRACESAEEHAAMAESHGNRRSWPGTLTALAWRAENWPSYVRRLSRAAFSLGGCRSLGSYALGPR